MKKLFLLLILLFSVVACDASNNSEQRGLTGLIVPTAVTRHPPLIITSDNITPIPTPTSQTSLTPMIDESCIPNTSGFLYTISAGDRLYNLAQQVNSTVEELTQANCLLNPDQLQVGQQLYLPQLPPTPTSVPVTTAVIDSLHSLYSNTTLGGTVSFSWSVQDASRVRVSWQTAVDEPIVLLDRVAPQGSYAVRVPEWLEANAITIVIEAWDEEGRRVQKTLDVPITSLDNAGQVSLDAPAVTAYSTATLRWTLPDASLVYLYWYPDQDGRWLQRELLGVFQGEEAQAHVTTIALDTPRAYGEIPLEMEVSDENGRLIARHTLPLTISCADTFFVNDPTRPIGTCPTPSQEAVGAYQPFEQGFMVWREDTATIYVFADDGSYITYDDTWQEGYIVDLTPPDGLFAPIRGFAKVWQENLTVQELLGWATQNEQVYTFRQQTVDVRDWDGTLTGDQYIELPNTVVRLNSPDYTTWQRP